MPGVRGCDNIDDGCSKDTGLQLTPTGILNMQWHFYNAGDQIEPDATRVQICTVPKTMRKNIGSLTFLGTENFNGPFGMPAKTQSDFSGTCVNNSGGPITIFGFTPHMHKFGVNMKSVVIRNNGMMEEVFNKPFDFNSQITHILPTPLTSKRGSRSSRPARSATPAISASRLARRATRRCVTILRCRTPPRR